MQKLWNKIERVSLYQKHEINELNNRREKETEEQSAK